MNAADLPPSLARSQYTPPPVDDDELPPWLGQRMRDATHAIHRAAREAEQDQQEPAR